LGVDIGGVVEVTYAYPYPQPSGKSKLLVRKLFPQHICLPLFLL